jgi:putative SOS response-associated peptidase YedK
MFGGVGPGETGTVIRRNPNTGEHSIDQLIWGLLPYDTADPTSAPRPTYARAETVAEKPMFADAFLRRRAIVPADQYSQKASLGPDEWRRFRISRRDGKPMGCAGLWESFVRPDGQIERTFCVITVVATGPIAEIHDRVPVVLELADWPLWLGDAEGDPASLLRAPAADVLRLDPVGASGRDGKRAGHV